MMTTKQTILSLLISVCSLPAIGQVSSDVIYRFDDEPLACIISDVTDEEIKYKDLENREGPDYVIKKDKALLVFKENGDFLLPGEGNPDWVTAVDHSAHKIITKDHHIYQAQFLEVQGTIINFQDNQTQTERKIDTDEVLLVIYRSGRHELFAPPDEVAEGLNQTSQKMDDYTPPPVKTTAEKAPSGEVIELDEDQKLHFEKMAEVKANDFGKYLRIISTKEEDEEDKLYAIEAACKLFISDSSKIEVSSLNNEKRQYTVPKYLDRLRMIPYDKVELIWMQAQLVSKLRPGEDGKYYGVIAAQQLFRGYLDNKIAYQDVTEKNIEVVLARYEVFDEGVKKQKWDVFLSDIGVQQTREK